MVAGGVADSLQHLVGTYLWLFYNINMFRRERKECRNYYSNYVVHFLLEKRLFISQSTLHDKILSVGWRNSTSINQGYPRVASAAGTVSSQQNNPTRRTPYRPQQVMLNHYLSRGIFQDTRGLNRLCGSVDSSKFSNMKGHNGTKGSIGILSFGRRGQPMGK